MSVSASDFENSIRKTLVHDPIGLDRGPSSRIQAKILVEDFDFVGTDEFAASTRCGVGTCRSAARTSSHALFSPTAGGLAFAFI